MIRPDGGGEAGGESPLSRAKNRLTADPLVWLVALVIGKGVFLTTLAIAWCWAGPITPERQNVCGVLLPGLVEQHGRTVELVVGLAAGAGLARRP